MNGYGAGWPHVPGGVHPGPYPRSRWQSGATPELPDPTTEWTWQAQQAYAVKTASDLAALDSRVGRAEGAGVLVAFAVGIVGGVLAAVGLSLWRRGM